MTTVTESDFWSRLAGELRTPARPEELVPPPRFRSTTFATYDIDPAIPGQGEAVDAIKAFVRRGRGFLGFAKGRPGLYLDGGFGVGKTHLIASCWHAATGTKRFLSFSEAMALMIQLGPKPAAALLAADLVCIDEFEIDDPANTRMADLLLDDLTARGCRIVTTSNTVPGDLGQGRMAVDLFRSQLARIAERFDSVHVPGRDHRRIHLERGEQPAAWSTSVSALPEGPRQTTIGAIALDEQLQRIPVPNLRRVAGALDRLCLVDVAPFTEQLAALRFVHLVDRLYDHGVQLRVRSTASIEDLFPAPHCQPAFQRKYRRCQSRLAELAG